MSDGKNRFRAHVRAAREWLGRAESSLDRQEDIRSDLNLMLAQAELQRAKETKRLTKKERLLHRLAPFMAAGAMAAGCFFFLQYERPAAVPAAAPAVTAAVPAVTAAVQTVEQPAAAEMLAAFSGQPKEDTAQAASVAQAADAAPETMPAVPTSPVEHVAASAAPASGAESAPAGQQVASGAPSESMQKLMRTAGQSLRAH